MYRSSDNFDAVQTVLDNTLPVHAHCGGHSTDTTPLPCYFPEPFDPAGCVISPLVGPTDASSRVRHVPADHVTGIQLYSEVQRNGQVTTSTERPSSMRACPSAASVLSYARSDTDSSANGPACRICDSAGDGSNRLISPCRCSGTSKFVHEQCLNVSSCALIRFLRFIDYFISLLLGCAFSALTLSVGWQEGHPAYKTLYTHRHPFNSPFSGTTQVSRYQKGKTCLERGADLHMAQLMPLPLTVTCFSKIQIGFTFLVPADLGSPGQRVVKRVCV